MINSYGMWVRSERDKQNLTGLEEAMSHKAWAAAVEAMGECPHGCTDGNCPWDRRKQELLA